MYIVKVLSKCLNDRVLLIRCENCGWEGEIFGERSIISKRVNEKECPECNETSNSINAVDAVPTDGFHPTLRDAVRAIRDAITKSDSLEEMAVWRLTLKNLNSVSNVMKQKGLMFGVKKP